MAAAETAKLIAELTLKDKLTPGVKTATASLGRLDSSLGRIGQSAKRGAAVAGKALLGLGAVAAVGIGAGVRSGLENLATLESAVTSVDGAIKQVGLTGQVTGAQVAAMANKIETNIGAAFDDKDITQAATTLIRFGKVTTANLEPALVVMTDLATKTGSVDSAATLLAKALADPEKAAGKLARTGVILTKEEQKQIKAFMAAGKAADAQKVILDSLARSTEGAAAASQGPYQRALSTLADVTEDAQKALAEGFLPVIERVAKWLSTSLADPRVMSDIRNLGKSLANVFDQGVSFVQKIPWGTVRESMTVVGNMAKTALDAFNAMPEWLKVAVVSGWGLNKLTGGALNDIIGGALKSVIPKMAIAAGIVNVNGPVTGLPTGGGGGPTLPVTGGLGAALMAVIAPASIVALGAAISGVMLYGIPKLVTTIYGTGGGNEGAPMKGKLGPSNGLTTPIFEAQMGALLRGVNTSKADTLATLRANQQKDQGQAAQMLASMNGVKGGQAAALVAFREAERTFANQKPPQVDITVPVAVTVSGADVAKTTTVRARYGKLTGSRATNVGKGVS